jgi:hypothetical protein
MKVTNVNGMNQPLCRDGNWLSYWLNFSNQSLPKYGPVEKCYERVEAGAPVQREDPADSGWYIIPLCKTHNVKAESLKVGDYVALLSVDIGEHEVDNFEDSTRYEFVEH